MTSKPAWLPTTTIAAAYLALALLNGRAIAAITINSVDISAMANVDGVNITEHFTQAVIPIVSDLSKEQIDVTGNTGRRGTAVSENKIDFSENSGQTILSASILNHSRKGPALAGIYAGIGGIYVNDNQAERGTPITFTTDIDTHYELSGTYDALGITGMIVGLAASLYDVTTNEQLFFNNQLHHNASNSVIFNLGENHGSAVSILSGSLTGSLLAGHTYEWSFNAYLGENNHAPSSATGNLKLVLGLAAAVPEAASAVIWLVIGLTATWNHRRRDRA